MERLTLSDYGRFKIPHPAGTKEKERPSYMDLYCRLAAYEDTSLEPEEVSDFDRLVKLYLEAGLDKQFVLACIEATKAGMTVDRLRELAQADREGRVEIIEPDVYECIKAARKAQAALRREQDE